MTLPSRKAQIEEVARWLGEEMNEGRTLEEIAVDIVDGYHDLLLREIKTPCPPLHPGLAFKSPITTKVHHVAWTDGRQAWIVTAGSRFGWLGPVDSGLWDYMEETKAKVGAPGNNPEWKVGDKVSRCQRMYTYEIIATGDKCVLMKNLANGQLQADSNDSMKLHYKRESSAKSEEMFQW